MKLTMDSNGNKILLNNEDSVPRLSDLRPIIINQLLIKLQKWFPDLHLRNFEIFDPRNFPDEETALDTFGIIETVNIIEYFNWGWRNSEFIEQ